jgi:catechol 2,3-dioxygenase-like lactoylglutathione lyase family enzyme
MMTMGMDHVSLTVRDVDRSVEFYSKGLGLKLLRVSILNPSPDTQFKNAYMYSGSLLLELITGANYATQPPPPASWQSSLRSSIGITHLGVRVKNLETAMTRLEAAGARKIGGSFEISNKTTKIIYVAKRPPPKNKIRQKTRQKTMEERGFLGSRRRRHRTSRTVTPPYVLGSVRILCRRIKSYTHTLGNSTNMKSNWIALKFSNEIIGLTKAPGERASNR